MLRRAGAMKTTVLTALLSAGVFTVKPRTPDGRTACHNPQQLLIHLFNGSFYRTIWVSRYQKGKTGLGLNEARGDRHLGCSVISWTICKQSAPHSRQITTPTPDAFPGAQPIVSKH